MTLDERAVMRWLMLSERERSESLFGAPEFAIIRVYNRLCRGMSVDKDIKARRDEISVLAGRILLLRAPTAS
jgi:hypothetical protein